MPLGAARFGLLGTGITPEEAGLTLINYQSVSSVTSVSFDSIDEDIYNHHLLTWTDIDTGIRDSANYWYMRLKVGGSSQTSTYINYGIALRWGSNSSQSYKVLDQVRNTDNRLYLAYANRGWGDNVSSIDSSLNGYAQIMYAGNSNYNTGIHTQAIGQSYATGSQPYTGTMQYRSKNVVDGLYIYMSGYSFSGKLALYGYN